ncbi:putative membrane protein [Serratia plymuthica A30]|jgi:hypothetical protein|nr:putative membrane protein [Serratia plymuthica A30]
MRAGDRRCIFWGGLSGHGFIIATAAICGLPAGQWRADIERR